MGFKLTTLRSRAAGSADWASQVPLRAAHYWVLAKCWALCQLKEWAALSLTTHLWCEGIINIIFQIRKLGSWEIEYIAAFGLRPSNCMTLILNRFAYCLPCEYTGQSLQLNFCKRQNGAQMEILGKWRLKENNLTEGADILFCFWRDLLQGKTLGLYKGWVGIMSTGSSHVSLQGPWGGLAFPMRRGHRAAAQGLEHVCRTSRDETSQP